MKAVVFKAPFELAVEEVDDPKIEQPLDAVIRITTANICGSDLHPCEGRAPLDAGMVLGHENMGIVEEVGSGVERGGQAEYLRVPWADFNLLELPAGTEHENDFTMLFDKRVEGWTKVLLHPGSAAGSRKTGSAA